MNEKDYYNLMSNMRKDTTFTTLHNAWYKCFDYILRNIDEEYTGSTIYSLFYNFRMDNWIALHKENTTYKDFTKEQIIDEFCGECIYISDRADYDRLFRTHWLFQRAFSEELDKLLYSN
jgi:hypothetical protein